MKLNSSFLLVVAMIGSIAVGIRVTIAPAAANNYPPQVSATCVAQVSTTYSPYVAGQSGTDSLASHTYTVANYAVDTLESTCATFTKAAFNANTAWSSAANFCARVGTIAVVQKHIVWATFYLNPPGNSNGVYLVAGYSVVCNGKTAANVILVPVPNGIAHENSTL